MRRVRLLGLVFSGLFSVGIGLISFNFGFALINYTLTDQAIKLDKPINWYSPFAAAGITIIGVIVGFLVGSILYRRMVDMGGSLRKIPTEDKLAAIFGTVFGLIPTFIFGYILWNIKLPDLLTDTPIGQDTIHVALVLLVAVLIIWLSNVIASSMKEEMKYFLPTARNPLLGNSLDSFNQLRKQHLLLLDTSAIIDGRIFDICRAGFLDGTIILPEFILEELQHIADSADALRRNRGRRGLDILFRMQQELDNSIHILDRYRSTFAASDEVDIKLVKLAKSLGNANLVTNDFNLNKVARLHGVRVLNVNELANALKPVILPGEEMRINIVREGKEYNQGVGYLDDGTMVVVEHGKPMIGQTVPVTVSSVLQTAAGKMIFAEQLRSIEDNQEETQRTLR